MTESIVDAGTCPLCGAELRLASVLIEYESDGETRRFVECPECGEPVRPER